MATSTIQTPGVYINELDAFPPAVMGVPTAIPAFIGYTPQASIQGRSVLNTVQKVNSFTDFKTIYGYPDPPPPAAPAKQYNPQYYLVKQTAQPKTGDYININGSYYLLLPDASTIYYFYNSIKFFYENGGGEAYIISVGTYGPALGQPLSAGAPIINPNIKLAELLNGLALLMNEQEPTMYICPDATLLSIADNGTLMQEMLKQNNLLKTAISIFDIIGGRNPDPLLYTNDISTFRSNTGSVGLMYGTAYYPFVCTDIMQAGDIDYNNFFGGEVASLAAIINPPANPDPAVTAIFAAIANPADPSTTAQKNRALLSASNSYSNLSEQVLAIINILPAGGAIAGVMTTTDNNRGVWTAPANVSIAGAVSLPIKLTDHQQVGLNVDALQGKSINALRSFIGKGIVVWGARTLDGNSNDWRYIPIRRTLIYIEQSCKLATQNYVFEPNDANTWRMVIGMLSNFLNTMWRQGALQGARPQDAFTVLCGVGSTMTSADILNGFLKVNILVALLRPAEFIVISFQQQMGNG